MREEDKPGNAGQKLEYALSSRQAPCERRLVSRVRAAIRRVADRRALNTSVRPTSFFTEIRYRVFFGVYHTVN